MASLKLTWAANPAAELVTSYEVLQRNDNTGPWVSIAEVAVTELVVNDLAAGQYAFIVKAKNIAGTSAGSVAVDSPGLPSAPTGLVLTVL